MLYFADDSILLHTLKKRDLADQIGVSDTSSLKTFNKAYRATKFVLFVLKNYFGTWPFYILVWGWLFDIRVGAGLGFYRKKYIVQGIASKR